MAYNYFPMNYQAYPQAYSQYQTPVQQPYQMPQNNESQIVWVQGIEGAKSYPVAPGKSVLLLDSESSVFFIKSSDASGMPLPLRVFDYTERTQQTPQAPAVQQTPEYVTRSELEDRLADFAARMNAYPDESISATPATVKRAPVRKEKTNA